MPDPGVPDPAGPIPAGPAFYAPRRRGGWRDWWLLLHPPYTAWNLSYVVVGACLAPRIDWGVLGATTAAFALGVGVSAHALDEWRGRPLGTSIASWQLLAAAAVSLAAAAGLGIIASSALGWWMLPLVAAGVTLVLMYNLELAGGVVHTDDGFAGGWGSFPLLVGYMAQTGGPPSLAAWAAAAFAFFGSRAQRALSTQARLVRRSVVTIDGTITLGDGKGAGARRLDKAFLLQAPEAALRALSWASVGLAAALLLFRLPS
ncbi:MAG: hypothetical protein ACYDH5_01845 [Acidimicrobiales bacterium]